MSEERGTVRLPPPGNAICCTSSVKCLPPPGEAPAKTFGTQIYGTGFFVSENGHILTNDHVVNGCQSLTLGTGEMVQIIDRDPKNDLALLKVDRRPERFARFRFAEPVKIGEPVIVYGFPLPGTLSANGVVTSGLVSSTTGLHDDPRTLQFSAAVQPGNSGGPVLDSNGHVIGVVEAKLATAEALKETGEVPENIGFAIQWPQINAFMETAGVTPAREHSGGAMPSTEIAGIARAVSVAIVCTQ